MKKFKKIPDFKNADEEFKFWSKSDTTEYADWSKAKPALFPRLKPTSRLISIRFPASMLDRLQSIANRKHVPYQSLIKTYVTHELERELRHPKAA